MNITTIDKKIQQLDCTIQGIKIYINSNYSTGMSLPIINSHKLYEMMDKRMELKLQKFHLLKQKERREKLNKINGNNN